DLLDAIEPRDGRSARVVLHLPVVGDATGAPALHLLVGSEGACESRSERDHARFLYTVHDDALRSVFAAAVTELAGFVAAPAADFAARDDRARREVAAV